MQNNLLTSLLLSTAATVFVCLLCLHISVVVIADHDCVVESLKCLTSLVYLLQDKARQSVAWPGHGMA